MRSSPMTRLIAGRALKLLLGMLVLIEAIFLAESFTTIMEIVVGNGGSVLDVLMLLALKSPEIIDFALPLVLLLSIYFAISGSRDDNELIICAAAGVSWLRIPGLAFRLGLAGCVVSILVAGYVAPSASFTLRLAIHGLETRSAIAQLQDPSPRNSIRTVQDRTIIATPSDDEAAIRGNLFIFEPGQGNGWRVSQAEDWTVVQSPGTDAYSVRMHSFRDYSGVARDAPNDGSLSQSLATARLTVKQLELDFRLEEVIRAFDQTRRLHELPMVGLSDIRAAMGSGEINLSRRTGEIIGRAMVCIFAALMAVAAVAWTGTWGGRYVALPIATVSVLAADIFCRSGLGTAAEGGVGGFFLILTLASAAALAVPALVIASWREAMIAPRQGRA